jgi:RNA polymerase sigma factor (sigma-70 family)
MVSPAHPLLRQLDGRDSDRELLERFVAAGDQDAFALLVDRHGPLVQRVCRRVLGDAHLADDAFQATFLLLARKAASLSNADAVGSWLFGVARRMSLATLRLRRRPTSPLTPEVEPEAPPERSASDELLGVLEEELARMPDHLRAPLIACYLQGQTQDEAARSLGWSIRTLRRRLEEGRELLRSRLTTRGASLPACLAAGALTAQTAVSPVLRAALLTLVAGGPVPSSVAAILAAVGSSAWVARTVLVGACLALLVGLGYAMTRPTPVPPEPVAQPGPVLEAGPLRGPWVEPLPAFAVARLGTTAFRHGTTGYFGAANPLGVVALSFQPDGTLVSIGHERVRVWEPETGRELYRETPWVIGQPPSPSEPVLTGGQFLAVPEYNDPSVGQPLVTVWDLQNRSAQEKVRLAQGPGDRAGLIPTTAAAGGRAFASLDEWSRGRARVWNADGTVRSRLDATFDRRDRLLLLPDGLTAISVESGQLIRRWDTHTGKATASFGGGLITPESSALSPDGRWLATWGRSPNVDPFVRLWDLSDGRAVTLSWPGLPASPPSRVALAFSPDSTVLAGAAAEGQREWQLASWGVADGRSHFWQTRSYGLAPGPLAVDAVRQRVAVSCQAIVRVFDSETGRELVLTDAHVGTVRAVQFTPDGDRVISIDQGGERRVWDATTGQLFQSEEADFSRRKPAVVPEIDFDVYALLRARAGPGEMIGQSRDGPLPMTDPALVLRGFDQSPEGRYVAVTFSLEKSTAQERGRVVVLDRKARNLRWQIPLAEGVPVAACFSPDGKRLAVGTTKVYLLDAATGALQATFQGHRGAIVALAFRSDGRRLASGSTDSTVLVWDCPPN